MVALPVVPLRERVVEVQASLGAERAQRYRYGSGFRLGGRLVLTAAHVVAGAAAAGITVRGPDKVPHPARVVDGLAGDPDTVDLALLELCDQTAELPAPPVAAVDRDAPVPVPVEGCWAVGYPLFQEVESAAGVVRETAQVWGMILPAENLVDELLSLHVTSAPRALPPQQEALGESQWSGMSGAAVFAGERLIGVVSEHATRRGESTISVTPLAYLNRLPAVAAAHWWAHLAADPKQLVMLPARRGRGEPAYRATLRQLRARTGVLQGRDGELEAVGAFATGRPSALAPPGSQHAWLTGGPWAGKTALLAEAVHALPPEVDCVAYFLTRPTGDADRERFLAAVVLQLAWLLGTDPPSAPDEHAFRQLWEQAAQHAADEGRQLLLMVDGLDEDLRPGGHSVAGWLPARLPGLPARVLVASRPHPGLPDDVDPAHPLAALTPDKLYTLPDSPHAARLRELAGQEITQLLRRASDDLALDVLGLLTAAGGGPLTVADFAALTGSQSWKVRGVLDGEAARTLQQVGSADTPRYTFAHETLLARCEERGVGDPGHARRIDEWAATWRDRGWPAAPDGEQGTPLYLLDEYPQTLHDDPPRLAMLAGDVGWVTAAIRTLGVDAVLAELKTADATAPSEPRLAAMHAAVQGQAHHLRDQEATDDPGFVPRHLCLQATELGENTLAADCRTRLLSSDDPGPVLQWTTRRASPALVLELGRDDSGVTWWRCCRTAGWSVAGTTGMCGCGTRLPQGTGPTELGRHTRGVDGWRCCQTAGWSAAGTTSGCWCGTRLPRDRPGPARSPRRRDARGGGAARRPRGHRRGRRAGAGVGPGCPRAPARPSSAATTAGCPRWRCCRTAGWSPGRLDERVLVWDPAATRGPARPISAVTAAGCPRWRCCRTAGWSPRDWTSGCWCGTRRRPGTGPARLDRDGGRVSAVAVLPDGRVVTGGATTGGCWCGTRRPQGPAQPGSAATTAGCPRWRCYRMGGWSQAGATGGCWCGTRPWHSPAGPSLAHDGEVHMVAVLPDGRVVRLRTATGQCWCGTRAARGPARSSLAATTQGVRAVAVLPDGRVVRRRHRTGGCWCGTPRPRGPARPSSAARSTGGTWWRCCQTAAWSAATAAGGCWCGTSRPRRPARPSSAATSTGYPRWRCCQTAAWSPATAAADGKGE